MNKKKFLSQDKIVNVLFYVIAILMIIAVVYPLWFVVIASFSNPADVANGEVWLWPMLQTAKIDAQMQIENNLLVLHKL